MLDINEAISAIYRDIDIRGGKSGKDLQDALTILRAIAAELEQPADPSKPQCADCGAPYGEDGWCDVVVPDQVWNQIDKGASILCFRCMTKRIEAHGFKNVPVIVASGPYADAHEEWRMVGWKHGHKVGLDEGAGLHREMIGKINSLRDLQPNWDSYNAPVITEAAFQTAYTLVSNLPTIVPCSNGGIQLEWHTQGIDFEVYIEPDGHELDVREQPDLRPGLEAAAIIQCQLCGRASWPEQRHGAWHHLGPGEIGLCYAPKIHEAIRALAEPKAEPQKAGAQ